MGEIWKAKNWKWKHFYSLTWAKNSDVKDGKNSTPMEEVVEIIKIPKFDKKAAKYQEDPDSVLLYISIVEQLEARLPTILDSRDLVQIALCMSMTQTFQTDYQSFCQLFYNHCYENRFLMQQKDKQTLSTIF